MANVSGLRWWAGVGVAVQAPGQSQVLAAVSGAELKTAPHGRGLMLQHGTADRHDRFGLMHWHSRMIGSPGVALCSMDDDFLAALVGVVQRRGAFDTHVYTGLLAVSRADDAVGIHRMLTGELLQEFPAAGKLHGLCFTADGDLILVRDRDGLLTAAIAERT